MAYIPNLKSFSLAGAPPGKGALLTASNTSIPAWLAAGPNTDTVVADSTQTDGLKWTVASPIIIDETDGDYTSIVPGNTSSSSNSGLVADAKHTHGIAAFAGTGSASTFAHSDHTHGTRNYLVAHTFSVNGNIQVPSAGVGFIPPFFVQTANGQTVTFYGWAATLRGGTSAQVTFSIVRIPETSMVPGAPSTLVAAGTGAAQGYAQPSLVTGVVPVASPTTLSAFDQIGVSVASITNVPDGMSVSIFLLYTN